MLKHNILQPVQIAVKKVLPNPEVCCPRPVFCSWSHLTDPEVSSLCVSVSSDPFGHTLPTPVKFLTHFSSYNLYILIWTQATPVHRLVHKSLKLLQTRGGGLSQSVPQGTRVSGVDWNQGDFLQSLKHNSIAHPDQSRLRHQWNSDSNSHSLTE